MGPGAAVCLSSPQPGSCSPSSPLHFLRHTLQIHCVSHHLRRVGSTGRESDWFGGEGVCSFTPGGWKKEKCSCLWIFPSEAVTLSPGFTLKPVGNFLPIFYENFKYTAKWKEFYTEQRYTHHLPDSTINLFLDLLYHISLHLSLNPSYFG